MRRRVDIKGRLGRWTVEIEGRQLPVIHQTLLRKLHYRDAAIGASRHLAEYAKLMGAFQQESLVVLQKDKPGTYRRDGHIAVYGFADFQMDPDGGFSLNLISRYADPK